MFLTEFDCEKISEINKCKEKIIKSEKEISKINFDIKVYQNYLISQIHNLPSLISGKMLSLLWDDFNKEEKSEKYKPYYSYINDIIKEDIYLCVMF